MVRFPPNADKIGGLIPYLGAGISVQAGIPDFRSSEGLFQTIKRDNPREAMSSGKELFDVSVFNVSLTRCCLLLQGEAQPEIVCIYNAGNHCDHQLLWVFHSLPYFFHCLTILTNLRTFISLNRKHRSSAK